MVKLYPRHVLLSEVVFRDYICDCDSYLAGIHTWYMVVLHNYVCTMYFTAIGVSDPSDPEFTKITSVPTRIRSGHIPPRDDLHNLQLAILCTFVSSILVLRTEHLPLGILWMFSSCFFEYAGFQTSLGFNLGKHLLYLIIATPNHPR